MIVALEAEHLGDRRVVGVRVPVRSPRGDTVLEELMEMGHELDGKRRKKSVGAVNHARITTPQSVWRRVPKQPDDARESLPGGAPHAHRLFAPTGEIARVTMQRHRDVNGTAVLTPFEGVYAGYERGGGVLVPTRAEVAWLLPEGRFAYWRARPERIEYGAPPDGP